MSNLAIRNIIRFVLLIILQVLMLNYVNLGSLVMPFLYLLALLMLPTRFGKVPMLVTAFVTGLLVDIFCLGPGFHTFSYTLVAFARILFGNRILTHGDPIDIDVPSVHTVAFGQYSAYLFLMSAIYCTSFYLLEAGSFSNFGLTLLAIFLSTLVTWALMLLCQLLIKKENKN